MEKECENQKNAKLIVSLAYVACHVSPILGIKPKLTKSNAFCTEKFVLLDFDGRKPADSCAEDQLEYQETS